MFYTLRREYDKSIAEAERAVGLEPGGASTHLCYGMSLYLWGPAGRSHSSAAKINPTQPLTVMLVAFYTSATPTGRLGGFRKLFRNIRSRFNVPLIISLRILV